MSKIYKLCFEVVTAPDMVYFFKRHGIRISEVAEKYWQKVEKEDADPWQQFNQLKEWASTGEEPIRNVHLFETEKIENWKEIFSQ